MSSAKPWDKWTPQSRALVKTYCATEDIEAAVLNMGSEIHKLRELVREIVSATGIHDSGYVRREWYERAEKALEKK